MSAPIDWVAVIEEASEAIRRQPAFSPPAPIILSRARYAKCKAGDHDMLHGICVHCLTDTRPAAANPQEDETDAR